MSLDCLHLTFYAGVAPLLVLQAISAEISTVLCNGDIIVEDGTYTALDNRAAAESVRERSQELVPKAG